MALKHKTICFYRNDLQCLKLVSGKEEDGRSLWVPHGITLLMC